MNLVIVIPAYNEEDFIGKTLNRIPKSFKGINSTQVVVVNDGSNDNTAEEAEKNGAMVVSYYPNKGVGRAFQIGLEKALELNADILVNIDADGQFSPYDIPLVIQPIINGNADFVPSDRFTDKDGNYRKPVNMPTLKYWGNKQMSKIISLLAGQKFSDVSSGFRAYSREAMLNLNLNGQFTYTQESFLDLAMKGISIEPVPVDVVYGKQIRKSRVFKNIPQYAYRTLSIIIKTFRDYKPFAFFGFFAAISFLISFATGLFSGYTYLKFHAFTPYKWVALTALYTFSLALVLLIMSMIADMFDRSRRLEEKILYLLKRNQYYGAKKDKETSSSARK